MTTNREPRRVDASSTARLVTIADLVAKFGQTRAGIFALEQALLRALGLPGALIRVDGRTIPELPGYQLIAQRERARRAEPN